MRPAVGWIGTGTMGRPMAAHALRAGFPLTVWNRTPGRTRPLIGLGARAASSAREAASAAAIVVVTVSSREALAEVLGGPDGALAGLKAGSLLVDMGTSGVSAALSAAGKVRARGAGFLDAPVLGSRVPAEQGRLVVMAGGPAAEFERAVPLFRTFSHSVHRVGEVGAGQAMKLAANFMLAHMLSGLAGALGFAQAAGLPPASLVEILDAGLGSPYFRAKGGQMVEGDFDPHFTLDLARKDVGLIREALAELGLSIGTIPAIAEIFEEAARRGWGGEDGAAIAKLWLAPRKSS